MDACVPATRLNIDRWHNVLRLLSILPCIIPCMETPSTPSVALIFGLYRPSSGPIDLRNVLNVPLDILSLL